MRTCRREVSALVLLALGAASCAELFAGRPRAEGDPRFYNFSRSQAICTDPSTSSRGAVVRVSDTLSIDDPLDVTVRRLMCTDHPRGALHRELYHRYRPDEMPVAAGAMIVMTCVGDGQCHRTSGSFSYGVFGTMLPFARIEPAEVERAFASVPLRREVREALLVRYVSCRSGMLETRETLEPRMRAVFVDTVAATMREWASATGSMAPHERAAEALRQRVDAAFLSGTAPPELVGEVRALRDTVVAACLARGGAPAACFGGPVARPLGEALARLAVVAGDGPLAHAEARLLADWPDVSDVRYAIHAAVGRAIREETEQARAYDAALRAGVSPEAAAAHYGGHRPEDLDDYTNAAGLPPPSPPSLSAELRRLPPVDVVTETVGSLRLGGGRATVHFRAESPTRREEPVTLAAAEAEGLSPGTRVEVAVDRESRRAALVRAFAPADGSTLLRVRGLPVAPSP